MSRLPQPVNSSTDFFGLGYYAVHWNRSVRHTPEMLGRRVLDNTPTALPRYQFNAAPDPDGSAQAYAWLHNPETNVFRRLTINTGVDINAAAAPFAHVTAVSTTGTAAAFIYHSTHGYVGIWSEATGSDGVGIDCHVGLGTYTSVGATMTATDFGYVPGSNLGTDFIDAPTTTHWRTFAAMETPSGNVRVIGLLHRAGTSRSTVRDLAGYELVTFTIDPINKNVLSVSGAELTLNNPTPAISVDVPFEPHQVASGYNVPLDGSDPTQYVWCIGRVDPNAYDPIIQSGDMTYPEGMHTQAGEGIWVCDDAEGFSSWKRVWSSAHSQSHQPEEPMRKAATPTVVTPRDIGLAFDEAWQALTPVGVGQDSSQDPVILHPVDVGGVF